MKELLSVFFLINVLLNLGCSGNSDPLRDYSVLKNNDFSVLKKAPVNQVMLREVFRVNPLVEGNIFFILDEEKSYEFEIRPLQEGIKYSVLFKNLPETAQIQELDPENRPYIYTLNFTPNKSHLNNEIVKDLYFSVDIKLDDENSVKVKNIFESVSSIKKIFYRIQIGGLE